MRLNTNTCTERLLAQRAPQFPSIVVAFYLSLVVMYFQFAVDISELGNRVLEMSVWNSATFSRNSFLGHLQIGLDAWKWQPNPTPHWYPLKQKVGKDYFDLSAKYLEFWQ